MRKGDGSDKIGYRAKRRVGSTCRKSCPYVTLSLGIGRIELIRQTTKLVRGITADTSRPSDKPSMRMEWMCDHTWLGRSWTTSNGTRVSCLDSVWYMSTTRLRRGRRKIRQNSYSRCVGPYFFSKGCQLIGASGFRPTLALEHEPFKNGIGHRETFVDLYNTKAKIYPRAIATVRTE